jgi:hypothetical protein
MLPSDNHQTGPLLHQQRLQNHQNSLGKIPKVTHAQYDAGHHKVHQ